MKRVMLSILLAFALSIFTISLAGCHTVAETAGDGVLAVHDSVSSTIGGHGLGETDYERTDDHSRQLRLNGSMMIDDLDAISQTDRASRLTEYTVR